MHVDASCPEHDGLPPQLVAATAGGRMTVTAPTSAGPLADRGADDVLQTVAAT